MRLTTKSTCDVVVVRAGLAGLACARDLVAGGADVVLLEARERPGGRVEQQLLPDGRPVQLGGELTAEWQYAYMEGAVRTGRDAASQALGRGPRELDHDRSPPQRAGSGSRLG